jgi:hypothetical protein
MVEPTNREEKAANTGAPDNTNVPEALIKNVYVKSRDITEREEVRGYDFNQGIDYQKIFATYRHTGF